MMPVVCAAALKADELAAIEVDVLGGLSSVLALAEELLIKARANKAIKASDEMVNAANNFFAFVFSIIFCPFSDNKGFNPLVISAGF